MKCLGDQAPDFQPIVPVVILDKFQLLSLGKPRELAVPNNLIVLFFCLLEYVESAHFDVAHIKRTIQLPDHGLRICSRTSVGRSK